MGRSNLASVKLESEFTATLKWKVDSNIFRKIRELGKQMLMPDIYGYVDKAMRNDCGIAMNLDRLKAKKKRNYKKTNKKVRLDLTLDLTSDSTWGLRSCHVI